MNVLSKTPTAVVVAVTALFIATLTSLTILIGLGRNVDDLFRFINVVLSGVGALLGTGAFVYAGAAAKSSGVAEEKLNGSFDDRVKQIVKNALTEHSDGSNG